MQLHFHSQALASPLPSLPPRQPNSLFSAFWERPVCGPTGARGHSNVQEAGSSSSPCGTWTRAFWKQHDNTEQAGGWDSRDPGSADPGTGCLAGCAHPQGSRWQLFLSTALKMKDTDPHVPVVPGCLSTAAPHWPFGQEPIRS